MRKLFILFALLQISINAQTSSPITSEAEQEKNAQNWERFDWRNYGLTQVEFSQIKKTNISPERFHYFLEIGISASEYLQKPWLKLRVSEDFWLEERAKGLSDQDIDRSWDMSDGLSWPANLSVVFPGYFNWYSGEWGKGLAYSGSAIGFWGASAYYAQKSDDAWKYFAFGAGLVHVLSWVDARYSRNEFNKSIPLLAFDQSGQWSLYWRIWI